METKTVRITTAQGPAECQLAAAKILSELLKDLRSEGLTVTVLDRVAGQENGTILSATVQVVGANTTTIVQPWLGTILWVQKSPYRPNHGRKNWYVGIFELNQKSPSNWKEDELAFQMVRSSGAGGQHVNKVSSAVRVVHVPTGISVFAQDARSQFQNKKRALERITVKLEEHFSRELIAGAQQQWSQHHELERGNPIKVFTGMDFRPKKADKSFKTKRTKLKQEL